MFRHNIVLYITLHHKDIKPNRHTQVFFRKQSLIVSELWLIFPSISQDYSFYALFSYALQSGNTQMCFALYYILSHIYSLYEDEVKRLADRGSRGALASTLSFFLAIRDKVCGIINTFVSMNSPMTIFRASAGSGKTFTLTAEYVALLLATPMSNEAEHILAVTFTNKATAEMKDRILESLYAIGHDLKGSDAILKVISERLEQEDLHIERSELRRRARAALSTILHDYGRFRVETIDSFFQSILHTLARELGLASGLRVELNSNQVVARAVDRVMDHLAERPQVCRWVLDYVREQIENSDRWDIRGGMNSLGRCIYEEAYQNRAQQGETDSEDGQERIRTFKHTLLELKRRHEQETALKAMELTNIICSQSLDFQHISYGQTFSTFLKKASMMGGEGKRIALDLPGTRITDAISTPSKLLRAADKKDPVMMRQAQDTAADLASFCARYAETLRITNSVRLALHYLPPLRLLGAMEEEAADITAEAGQFLLSRTASLLSKMVDKSDAPFVLERAGVQFHHVMIDEFQDTSRMQWNNFRSLLMENLSTGGHSLLVGDVKQSIYRWRGGDWEILQGASRELAYLAPQEKTLDTNWRSLPSVVDFNNRFFPQAANLMDSMDSQARFRLTDIYADAVQHCARRESRQQGMVSVCLYRKTGNSRPDDYEERMVTEMATYIRELKAKGLEEQDIAILVRRNKMAARLLTLFHDLAPDIRLVSDEAFLLQSSISVQMIMAALRLIADGGEKTDPVVLRFLMMHYQQDVLESDVSPVSILERKPEEMLPEELLEGRGQLARLPIRLLTERVYHILQLDRIAGQDAYVLAFMDEVQNYLANNPQDLHQLLQAWDDSISTHPIPGGEAGGIRILTIHKSKGLEYHTVLLPYMDWSMGADTQTDNLLWCHSDEKPFDQLGTLPIRICPQMENSVFGSDYKEEMLQRRVDTLNMIYVAFTRARCNLMMWGITSAKDERISCVGDLIYHSLRMEEDGADCLRYEQGSLCCPEKKRKEGETPQKQAQKEHDDGQRLKIRHDEDCAIDIYMSSQPPGMNFMQSSLSRQFIHTLDDDEDNRSTPSDSYIETGKLMHYALSRIEYASEASQVMDSLEADGLASRSGDWQKARNAIERGLRKPVVAQWFTPDKQVVRECNIICTDKATGEPEVRRPDRVIMDEKSITVVDYKFGRQKPEYHDQVRQYMSLLQEMYPEHHVKGWLWYVYSGKTEEVTC